MAFFDCHFFSEALGMTCSAYVLLPQQTSRQIGMASVAAGGKVPTLYLLHGLSDDHTTWMRRTSIERYAAARNLAVVMPAVGRSFYQDMAKGGRYWSFLSEELPALCESWFPLGTTREDRFAAGLSMGGYGALRLAFSMPDRYAAAASLSGALDIARRLRETPREGSRIAADEWAAIFGSEPNVQGTSVDLNHLAQELSRSAEPKPDLYLACGTEDALLRDSRDFRDLIKGLDLPLTYEEGTGDHDWRYWDAQIQRVLAWLPLGE